MKIAIVGGAGVRTPLLVNGLTRSDLPIQEIALFDTDAARLEIIGSLAGMFAPTVRTYRDAAACMQGAAFILLSIRVGGIAARVRDEAVAVAHDTPGQETVGPGGFAMAMRTIPAAVEYAQLARREAPDAWVVSFTNPVGIVTQAMTAASPRTDRHLRYADRAVRGHRTCAGRRFVALPVRLFRLESPRLAARGLRRR